MLDMKVQMHPLFNLGFRPFFLGASSYAIVVVGLWFLVYAAGLTYLTPGMAAFQWHAHEMIFGYAAAVVAGFLLTAIPNWTGRLPVCGGPLAALVTLWLAGRVAMLSTAAIGLAAADEVARTQARPAGGAPVWRPGRGGSARARPGPGPVDVRTGPGPWDQAHRGIGGRHRRRNGSPLRRIDGVGRFVEPILKIERIPTSD